MLGAGGDFSVGIPAGQPWKHTHCIWNEPTRRPYRVGCCCSVAKSCPTLCDPMVCSQPWMVDCQAPLSLGFSRQEYWFSSVQFSCVQLFVTTWTAAHQASLSFTISRRLLKLTSIESVMPSNHLILCHPLLLLLVFPSIRGFSNESVLHIR